MKAFRRGGYQILFGDNLFTSAYSPLYILPTSQHSHWLDAPPPQGISDDTTSAWPPRIFKTGQIRGRGWCRCTEDASLTIFYYGFFYWRPRSKYIDSRKMVKNSEISTGANIFIDANILRISSMVGRYDQAGQYGTLGTHISQAAVRPQALSDYKRRRQHLQRRTPARSKRLGSASLEGEAAAATTAPSIAAAEGPTTGAGCPAASAATKSGRFRFLRFGVPYKVRV